MLPFSLEEEGTKEAVPDVCKDSLQVQRVSGAYIVQQRRQSLTPLRLSAATEGGGTPGIPWTPGMPDTPGGLDASVDPATDADALADDEHFVVEEHAHRHASSFGFCLCRSTVGRIQLGKYCDSL